jgi:hypothetical protein
MAQARRISAMFVVRGKSGKVVGRYATKAEAERRVEQLRAGAARLAPYKFGGGRSARSSHSPMHSLVQANFLEHAWAVWTRTTPSQPWRFHTAYLTREEAQKASQALSYSHDVRVTHEGYGDAPKSSRSPQRERDQYTKRQSPANALQTNVYRNGRLIGTITLRGKQRWDWWYGYIPTTLSSHPSGSVRTERGGLKKIVEYDRPATRRAAP